MVEEKKKKRYPNFTGEVQIKEGNEYVVIGKSALWTYKDDEGRINFLTGSLTFDGSKVMPVEDGRNAGLLVVRFNAKR